MFAFSHEKLLNCCTKYINIGKNVTSACKKNPDISDLYQNLPNVLQKSNQECFIYIYITPLSYYLVAVGMFGLVLLSSVTLRETL